MNTEKLAVICLCVFIIAIFGLMAFDSHSQRQYELEMAKAGFVRGMNMWVKAEGGCK